MHKRAFERIHVNIEAKFSCCHEDYTGIINNISESGMFVLADMNFPFNPQVKIHIQQKERILSVDVKIVRVAKTKNFYNGMGVEVVQPTEEYLKFVNGLKIYL